MLNKEILLNAYFNTRRKSIMSEKETNEIGFGKGTLTEEELIMLDSLLY